ncbi:receptor-type tyrosine-protein phosphatase eta-like [Engystomops pustulosus]|uniref:receptor-type tyrosine-protein phosphatase eta-like n=1 Tax=Engystomops pustulosus TaxID=76066 RepID=UPI003AFB481A
MPVISTAYFKPLLHQGFLHHMPEPEIVKNLKTGLINTTSMLLSWDPPAGNISSYKIHILGDANSTYTVTTTSSTIQGLTPGNYYILLVTALVGEYNVKGNSSEISAYTKPEIVKNLTTGLINTTSIFLSWDPPAGNASSYEIQILGDPNSTYTVTTTSSTIQGLTPGNYYILLVTALVGEHNVRGDSSEISAYTKPEIVKNLTTGLINTTSIFLSWDPPAGNASSYEIQILGDPNSTYTVTTTSSTIQGLTPGNYYILLVTSLVGEYNVRGNSSEISAYTKPEIVKNLTTGLINTTSIFLSWDPPAGNASSYEIQILGDPNSTYTVTTTSSTIQGLTPGNYYILLVTSLVGEYNVRGNSSEISAYTKPEIVKNLTTGLINTTSIFLSWDPPAGNASSYEIQILGDPNSTYTVTTTSSTIQGLTPGNYYILLVTSLVGEYNVRGNSSEISAYTKPEIVKNLTTGLINTTSIFLSWDPPAGNASSYEIQILGDPNSTYTVTTTSSTIQGLTPGNYYILLVTALVGEHNVRGDSSEISAYTKPEIVKNLTTGLINTTSIFLSWVPPAGNASSYEIQILGDPNSTYTVTTTSSTIQGLTPGNYYILLVTALVGEHNVRGDSSEISAYTKPEIVKNLTTGLINTTSIFLSWDPPAGNASSYEIQILGDPNSTYTVTTTSSTIQGLTPGNYYILLFTALVGEHNVRGDSSEISAYTS